MAIKKSTQSKRKRLAVPRRKASEPLILGIVGMPASGKTWIAEHLSKQKGTYRIHLGDFVWNFLKKRGIKPTDEMGLMASLYLWTEYADAPIVDWAIKEIKKAKGKKVYIIDSLRTTEEARLFKDKYKDRFKLLAVLAPSELRYKRESKRARFGKVSKLSFRIRDRGELRIGVGDLIASADYYIDSTQSDQIIKKQALKILKIANK